MKKVVVPDQMSVRQKLLQRICEARFPKDTSNFTADELKAAGFFTEFKRPENWEDETFKHFVLLAVQAKELRKQRDRLAHRVEILKNYRSPKWDEVWDEACPIKQAALRREAEEDDIRVNNLRQKERDPLAAFSESLAKIKWRPWKHRDQNSRDLHFHPALWHEPMKVMDYHEATGLSRRTIQNMLDRLKAHPIAKRKRLNEPFFYDQKTNHAILCGWLVRNIKNPAARRGLLVRTLLRCQHDTPLHYPELKQAIQPVLRTLDKKEDFEDYLEKCKVIVYPPPKLSPFDGPFLSELMSLVPPSE